MTRGEQVLKLASMLVKQLKKYSKKVSIAGSIRRGKTNPGDIDIVLIPKNKIELHKFMLKQGKFIQGGDKESTWKINNVKVELYYTDEKEFGAALLAYSGRKGSNIGLRIIARLKGYKLNQHGLFNRKTGKFIAGRTEQEIYKALKRPYKRPENR